MQPKSKSVQILKATHTSSALPRALSVLMNQTLVEGKIVYNCSTAKSSQRLCQSRSVVFPAHAKASLYKTFKMSTLYVHIDSDFKKGNDLKSFFDRSQFKHCKTEIFKELFYFLFVFQKLPSTLLFHSLYRTGPFLNSYICYNYAEGISSLILNSLDILEYK